MSRSARLAPIVVTEYAPRILTGDAGELTGSKEVWAAQTTDGAWDIIREDIPGTPWAVVRRADQRGGGSYGTLRAARIAIAGGAASFEANRCWSCQGSGDLYEERVGAEHARGHVGWRQLAGGQIAYRHLAGRCPCCRGTGREGPVAAMAA